MPTMRTVSIAHPAHPMSTMTPRPSKKAPGISGGFLNSIHFLSYCTDVNEARNLLAMLPCLVMDFDISIYLFFPK